MAVRRYPERLQKRLEVLNAGQQRLGCQSEGKGAYVSDVLSIVFPRPVRRLHPLSDFTGFPTSVFIRRPYLLSKNTLDRIAWITPCLAGRDSSYHTFFLLFFFFLNP